MPIRYGSQRKLKVKHLCLQSRLKTGVLAKWMIYFTDAFTRCRDTSLKGC